MKISPFIAIDKYHKSYVHLTTEDIQQCSDTKPKLCKINMVRKSTTSKSCELALIQNDKEAIHNLCDFRYLTDQHESSMFELSPSVVVLSNIDEFELNCPNGTRTLKGCKLCLVNTSCQCAIATKDQFIPPRLQTCREISSPNITVLHPVNLALLQHFFSNELLKNIYGNTTYPRPLNITVPYFHIYNNTYSTFLAQDKEDHLSLRRMAEAAKRNSMIFRTMAEPLVMGKIPIQSSFVSWQNIVSIISVTLASASCLAFIWTYRRLCTLSATILLLNQGKVSASTLPSFHYIANTKPTDINPDSLETLISHLQVQTNVTMTLLVIIVILSVTILVSISKLWLTRTKGTNVILKLTHGQECVEITILNFSLCPEYMSYNSPKEIGQIEVSGVILHELSFELPDFIMTNKMLDAKITIPASVSISPLMAWKIKQIMATSFNAYVMLQHGNHRQYIFPPQKGQNKLYPDLSMA
jgi:hypothetical protein